MSQREPVAQAKPRPAIFRALGRHDPPLSITIGGRTLHRTVIFKHDSWAATAIYEAAGEKVVCKFNRQRRLGFIPMKWAGRYLARHEAHLLRLLAGLAQVPRLCGEVFVDGVVARHAVAHPYIEGHPLAEFERVGDDFFIILARLLDQLHALDIAYVDLHKRENIIVGDDGRPHLIDFQVSFALPRGPVTRFLPVRWWLRLLQRGDRYHLHKHMCRHRPDLLPSDQRDENRGRPWFHRALRCFGNPLRKLRRGMFVLLGVRRGKGRATSEHDPEDAVRRSLDSPTKS
jgi:predicted Ser/Thr protein kinase